MKLEGQFTETLGHNRYFFCERFKMKGKAYIFVVLLIAFIVSFFSTISCSGSPSFANPPVEIVKIAWRLGQAMDNSPWIFLDVTLKNTGNRDIKRMSYLCEYYRAYRMTNGELSIGGPAPAMGDLLEDGNVLKVGETDIFRIPILSLGILDNKYVVEQILSSFFCIHWIDYTGFGSWGIKTIKYYMFRELHPDAFITELADWSYLWTNE